MSRNWRWVLPAYLFCLPMTIAGMVISILFYKARSWLWYDGVLTCVAGTHPDGTTRIWGKPNAQTLGWIQIYDTEEMRAEPNLRVHENVHVVQAFAGSLLGLAFAPLGCLLFGWNPLWGLALGGLVGGLGFAALYAILFFYFMFRDKSGWYEAYMANPFEIQAYNMQDTYLADTSKRPWGV